MRALIDTNVIMDVLFSREEFIEPAARLWLANEEGRFEGYVSAITPVNVFYIARREKNANVARELIAEILSTFHVCPLDISELQAAMSLPLEDYEDAVQVASALSVGLDAIVTRNTADYRKSPLAIFTPAEFLAKL